MAGQGKPTARPAPLAASLPLVALAGCVDGIGWLRLEGFFVSFMSGNTTQLGVAATGGGGARALLFGVAVGLFTAGALAGFAAARVAGRRREAVVLAAVAAALLLAWRLPGMAGGLPAAAFALLPAMGALNAALPGVGGITFVTGALVRFAEQTVAALAGEAGAPWRSHLAAWAALAVGAGCGGWLHSALPRDDLLPPAIAAAMAAAIAIGWPRR